MHSETFFAVDLSCKSCCSECCLALPRWTACLPAAAGPPDAHYRMLLPLLQVVAVVITQFILAYAVRDWDWWKVRLPLVPAAWSGWWVYAAG